MLDACLDLLLGSSCAVCARPGRVLCRACADGLPSAGRVCWPTPRPVGLALPVSAGEYDGTLKALVNAHKERRQFALARPLGTVLAHVVRDLIGPEAADRPVLLVPVPSRAVVVRSRGHDPMLRTTRLAANQLRRWGLDATVVGVLQTRTVVRDQSGLHAVDRARNLAGSMQASGTRLQQTLRRRPGASLVITDDVLTTGSTAREAQRALEDGGATVAGIATVAATRKRLATTSTSESLSSLPFSGSGD